ncbi:MAG: nuclear transport factor 2 family protein [Halioglobus sp.]
MPDNTIRIDCFFNYVRPAVVIASMAAPSPTLNGHHAMTTPTGNTPTPERVADRLAIHDILHLHCRGLDRLDRETIQCAYWPDAEVDYGGFRGSAQVFAELVVGSLGEQYALTRHTLANMLVAFDGDTARVESAVTAAHLAPDASEEMLFYGRYLDWLQRRDGRWKILHRQVVMDWMKRVPVQPEGDSETLAAMARGAHGERDPLYSFLNLE